MRKALILVVLALAAVPAALADDSPSPTTAPEQRASALCKQQRLAMGSAFTLLYGGARNAYGRCVSKVAGTVSGEQADAAKLCKAERDDAGFAAAHAGKTFAELYGTGKHGNNAFGRCVSSKAKTLEQKEQQATISAAKTCKAEHTTLGPADFKKKYGGRSNAFGKCVSKTAKTLSP